MSTYSADVLATSGLLYYWQFTEPSGTSAADSQGTNTGTYTGGFTLGQGGIPGDNSAVLFNGSTGEVTTTTSIANPLTFSIECWFKTTNTSVGLMTFGDTQTGNPASADRLLYVGTDGLLYFGIFAGTTLSLASSGTVTDGNWHHAVAVLAANNNMTLYVDGSNVTSNANTTAPANFTGFWRWGRMGGLGWTNIASAAFFNGTMSHAAIYNAALSSATALDHYTVGSTAPIFVRQFNPIPFMR